MSEIPDRTRAEAQRDIAVAALKNIINQSAAVTNPRPLVSVAQRALARIAEIQKTAPKEGLL